MRPELVLVVTLLVLPGAGYSQSERALSIGLRGDALSPASDGGGAELGWRFGSTENTAFQLGLQSNVLAGTHWSYGLAGARHRLGGRNFVSGQLLFGGGDGRNIGRFAYLAFKAGVAREVVPGRLTLEASNQYFHVGRLRDNLLGAGAVWAPSRRFDLGGAFHISAGGNTSNRFGSLKISFPTRKITPYAGFVAGRVVGERFGVFQEQPAAKRTRQYYGGAAIPWGRHQLLLGLETLRQPEVRRHSLFLVWQIGL